MAEFGTGFFNTFIALSPAVQIVSLFSGCYNILENEDEAKYYSSSTFFVNGDAYILSYRLHTYLGLNSNGSPY